MSDPFDCEIVYSKRKSIGLYVYPDQRVVVRAPHAYPKHELYNFVSEQSRWIEKKLSEFEASQASRKLQYRSGASHAFLGQPYRLQVQAAAQASVHKQGDSLVIQCRDCADTQAIERLLQEWYRCQARLVFQETLQQWWPSFAKYNLTMPELKVRKMKSRWGSCSSLGSINLSLELVKYPQPCIDYVLVHELCHLLEFNHSPRFYRLMDLMLPDWRRQQARLHQGPVSTA